jgi:hypothetical protein
MARRWTCRGCRITWPRTKQKCSCGRARPKARTPVHMTVLSEKYEAWEAKYGPNCGICGREPSATRRLDRDHDHATGAARGLLCNRCNRALPSWVTEDWLLLAAAYLRRGSIA